MCLAFAGIWAWVFFHAPVPAAAGELTRLIELPASTATGPGQKAGSQEVFILADAQLHNQSRGPLAITGQTAVLTLEDGKIIRTQALTPDAWKAAESLPEVQAALAQLTPHPEAVLGPALTIPEGQKAQHGLAQAAGTGSAEGVIAFAVPVAQKAWDRRRRLDVEVEVKDQPVLVLGEPGVMAGSR